MDGRPLGAGPRRVYDGGVAREPATDEVDAMLNRKDVSRRSFLRGAAAGAVAAPSFLPAAALGADGAPPPSDRVAVGLIGCGGMGRENLKNCTRHADVVAAAVCDVNKERLDATRAEYAATAQAFTDYRALLDMEDLDGVIIATPPHWHALQAIHACEARKDLFLQKPMTLYLAESLAVKNAVARHKRVSQIGTQIHAGENYRRVVELVRSGNLGKISVVRTFNVMNQGREGLGKDPNTTPPEGLDWNAWLGPAPARLSVTGELRRRVRWAPARVERLTRQRRTGSRGWSVRPRCATARRTG